MREKHLNFLSIFARLFVCHGLGNVSSDIPCRFMDAASDLAHRCVRTAARLQRATCTIGLAGSIDDGASLGDVGTQGLESAPLLPQYIPCRQRYSAAASSHWKSLLDSVASSRCVLSHTGMCGAICFSSTNQPSIGAAPMPYRR